MTAKEDGKMSASTVVIQGVVKPDGTLELDGKVPLPPGRVSVTVQAVPYSQETDPFFIMLREIRAARERAGLPPRSREEIDAQLREIREEIDEGAEAAGRLQEECRRQREGTAGQEQGSP
jgi:hypothetical protein